MNSFARLSLVLLCGLSGLMTTAEGSSERCEAGSDLQVAAKASAWSYSMQGGFRYNGHGFPKMSVRRMQSELCTSQTRLIRLNSRQATVEAIVTWNDEQLIIAFAGTTSESVRQQNLDARFADLLIPGIATHRGWSQAVSEFSRHADEDLASLAYGREVLITGHSSGGSLAAYFVAKHLSRSTEWMTDAKLITLGAARYGHPDFSQWMTEAADRMHVEMTEVVTRGRSRHGAQGGLVIRSPDGKLACSRG